MTAIEWTDETWNPEYLAMAVKRVGIQMALLGDAS